MLDDIRRLFENAELAIAGLVGAVIASRWHRDELNTCGDWAMFLLTGLACAYFLTDLAASHFGITSARNVGGVAFLIGAFGGSAMAAVSRAIRSSDLWSLFKSRFGGTQ